MIPRLVLPKIISLLKKGKAIVVLGPRQTGKTTLLQLLENELGSKALWLDCDETDVRRLLTDTTSTSLKNLVGKYKTVFIDEAQRVTNIGLTLKLFTDKLKDVQLVVTGSSSLDLANKVNEPLTGRKFEFILSAPSTAEMIEMHGRLEEQRMLNHRLVFGMYPDVILNPGHEKIILKNLSGSYLYKDILGNQEIRKVEVLEKLLEALARQTGSEVSFNELSGLVSVDQNTIQRYINLLEQSFVIFRLRSFARNLRTELKKSRKIYFYDNGIRNALLGSFTPFENRPDKGALWENFLISERFKLNQTLLRDVRTYFWRTRLQQEIDFIEERDEKLDAFEFKYAPKKKVKLSKSFSQAYQNVDFSCITHDNYLDFLI